MLPLLAFATAVGPSDATQDPVLDVDSCVQVDKLTVQGVMDLELADLRDGAGTRPTSITVRCGSDGEEIRIEPWASIDGEGTRTIRLSPVVEQDPEAARQARSRELALAMAELVRRLQTRAPRKPAAEPEVAPKPAAVFVPTPAVAVTLSPSTARSPRWQLGAWAAFDTFAGGQQLAGGDLVLGVAATRLLWAELRGGQRAAADRPVPGGSLSIRATTLAVAIGAHHWWRHETLGAALLLRAQESVVRFQAMSSGGNATQSAEFGVLAFAVEPRLMVALGRWFVLEGSIGVGTALRGVVVRVARVQTDSMSGFSLSAHLGGAFRF